MSISAIQVHRWTRQEYERMVEGGVFHPEERVELIDGEILNMTPQGSLHATAIRLAEDALRRVYTKGFDVRVQMPLALEEYSEPEPDISLVTGNPRDYREKHPSTALLIVEVADKTLLFDREKKKRLYARNGIPEYWIINLVDGYLEVYRDPVGELYQFQTFLGPAESVSPLSNPLASLLIADLLP
ncbi:MAG: Uma2 family endonuclease [Candidatus Tectomicrobia bacterium]|uniref:Uma2 family endonuclease n=1 Tax=Tectimicrobiota bacterium TaxID=2528274 RepID=A0A933GJZ7_UNCTE|nr:Uma2 family endonuclease [Candidatus Tectomicrobia bacterium]